MSSTSMSSETKKKHKHSKSSHKSSKTSNNSGNSSSRWNAMDDASPSYDMPSTTYSMMFFTLICILFLGLFEISWNQTQNNDGCNYELGPITPYDYILADGITLAFISWTMLLTLGYYQVLSHYITFYLMLWFAVLAGTFEFAWMIVGSILFWHYNYNTGTCSTSSSYSKFFESIIIIKYCWIVLRIVAGTWMMCYYVDTSDDVVAASASGQRSTSGSKKRSHSQSRGNSNV